MAITTKKYRIAGVNQFDLLYNVATVVTAIQVHFVNKVDFKTDTGEIEFQGDQQSFKKFFMNGIEADVTADTYAMNALATVFAKTEVTASLPSGVATRTYFGETTETAGIQVGARFTCSAVELTGNTNVTIRVEMPICSLTVVEPPPLSYNGKGVLNMKLTAQKTAVDIAAAALQGVPSGGAYWYIDQLS